MRQRTQRVVDQNEASMQALEGMLQSRPRQTVQLAFHVLPAREEKPGAGTGTGDDCHVVRASVAASSSDGAWRASVDRALLALLAPVVPSHRFPPELQDRVARAGAAGDGTAVNAAAAAPAEARTEERAAMTRDWRGALRGTWRHRQWQAEESQDLKRHQASAERVRRRREFAEKREVRRQAAQQQGEERQRREAFTEEDFLDEARRAVMWRSRWEGGLEHELSARDVAEALFGQGRVQCAKNVPDAERSAALELVVQTLLELDKGFLAKVMAPLMDDVAFVVVAGRPPERAGLEGRVLWLPVEMAPEALAKVVETTVRHLDGFRRRSVMRRRRRKTTTEGDDYDDDDDDETHGEYDYCDDYDDDAEAEREFAFATDAHVM